MLEEQISFSGLTANTNGTTTLTGVKTVLCKSPYTETSGIAKQHSGGSSVVVAVTSGLLNQFVDSTNAETITGEFTFISTARPKYDTHPTFVADEEIIDKKYADDLAIAGSPDASTTVKGIIEIATPAQMGAGTASGETGALLVPPNSQLVKTSSGAGDENKVPVLDSAGTLANGFVDKARTWGTVQSFTANNCQITSDPDSANDAVRKSYLDAQALVLLVAGTAGEALAVGEPIYLKVSDGLLYRCDTDLHESIANFVGICQLIASGTGEATKYAPVGALATGLTGLTLGANYFLSSNVGTIVTTPVSLKPVWVGIAMSTTTLLVNYKTQQVKSHATNIWAESTGIVDTTSTTYVKLKEAIVLESGVINVAFKLTMTGGGGTAFGRIYVNGVAVGTERSTTTNATYTEDITVKRGDYIQIYAKIPTGTAARVENFYIYAHLANAITIT
jgi:hypothetical protein